MQITTLLHNRIGTQVVPTDGRPWAYRILSFLFVGVEKHFHLLADEEGAIFQNEAVDHLEDAGIDALVLAPVRDFLGITYGSTRTNSIGNITVAYPRGCA